MSTADTVNPPAVMAVTAGKPHIRVGADRSIVCTAYTAGGEWRLGAGSALSSVDRST